MHPKNKIPNMLLLSAAFGEDEKKAGAIVPYKTRAHSAQMVVEIYALLEYDT